MLLVCECVGVVSHVDAKLRNDIDCLVLTWWRIAWPSGPAGSYIWLMHCFHDSFIAWYTRYHKRFLLSQVNEVTGACVLPRSPVALKRQGQKYTYKTSTRRRVSYARFLRRRHLLRNSLSRISGSYLSCDRFQRYSCTFLRLMMRIVGFWSRVVSTEVWFDMILALSHR